MTGEQTYWQVAAGSDGRDYSRRFLEFGIACVGGDVQEATLQLVQEGDIVILKSGTSSILAAGPVVSRDGAFKGVGDKAWTQDFDGWELNGWCYVDWHVGDGPFPVRGLTRTTIERTHQPHVHEIAQRLINGPVYSRKPQPPEPTRVRDDEILGFLVAQGLRPGAADELTRAVQRIRLLSDYYYHHSHAWEDIREHETRTFLVVPLLLALGWSEQQMKIELPCTAGRIDIALYAGPYSGRDEDCVGIIETKDFSSGLDYAPDQARTYAKCFPNCGFLVVTNGYCYKGYARDGSGAFSEVPTAYLNVLRPSRQFPLDPDIDGALEMLRHLLPMTRLMDRHPIGAVHAPA